MVFSTLGFRIQMGKVFPRDIPVCDPVAQAMMRPYGVLGEYRPGIWRASIIGPELCAFTTQCGWVPHFSPPMLKIQERASWSSDLLHASVCRFAVPGREGYQWHQDGDHAPGADMDCSLVLWSNREPTQIRWKDTIYQPEPFQVVVFHNRLCYHRRPPGVEGKRWVFRQRVQLNTERVRWLG